MQWGKSVASGNALSEINERVHLNDLNLVKNFLMQVQKMQPVSGKKLVKKLQVPPSVIAKLKKECWKKSLITENDAGISLSEKGKQLVESELGTTLNESLLCETCNGKTIVLNEKLLKAEQVIKKLQQQRTPKTHMDQSFVTARSSCERAALMLQNLDVEGKKIVCVGDSDLTSIALGFLGVAKKITVLDLDSDLLEIIQKTSREFNLKIECIQQDFREPLKTNEHFDVFVSDPPYTFDGLEAFVNGGKKLADAGYLTYSFKPKNELLEVEKILLEKNFAITWMSSNFIEFIGSGIIGKQGLLMKIVSAQPTERKKGFYTGEMRPVERKFVCANCQADYWIGKGLEFESVEALKEKKCARCNGTKFNLVQRKKV